MAFSGDKKVFYDRFLELQEKSVDEQADIFTRRFVFSLQDKYREVFELRDAFKLACAADEGNDKLSQAGGASFLEKQGKTRTGLQRKAEVRDIDINGDGRISFIEYLLLHYKVMILKEYFNRHKTEPEGDVATGMENDGVGLTGVGEMLVEELFSVPQGIDPELEKMMEEYSIESGKRKKKIEELEAQVGKGGVKGMAAKATLEQLKQQDETAMNAIEARIGAAVKKAVAKSKKALEAKEKGTADEAEAKRAAGRSKLAEKAAAFGKRVSQRLSGK